MSEFKERRCRECGLGTVKLTTKAGRKHRYKGIMLSVPEDLAIPTCDHCGNEGLRGDMLEDYTKAMDNSYDQAMVHRAQLVIIEITKYFTQKRLERLFGLSHGYLSKIRNGSTVPSQALLSGLSLLTTEPERRIHELEKQLELDN